MLTRNEKMLIADVLNGCGTLIAADPTYLNQMAGDEGAMRDARIVGFDASARIGLTGLVCCGLEHEVYDGIKLSGLAEKWWDVDGDDLLNKIRDMTPADRERLVRCVAEVWERNDENFERDLVALAV